MKGIVLLGCLRMEKWVLPEGWGQLVPGSQLFCTQTPGHRSGSSQPVSAQCLLGSSGMEERPYPAQHSCLSFPRHNTFLLPPFLSSPPLPGDHRSERIHLHSEGGTACGALVVLSARARGGGQLSSALRDLRSRWGRGMPCWLK